MSRYKVLKKSKWRLNKSVYGVVWNYALSYKLWKDTANNMLGVKGMNYDGMPHGSSVGNPTESAGIRYAELNTMCRNIERAAEEAGGSLSKWLLKGVTEDKTYTSLQLLDDMPCSRNTYYEIRRRFYYKLAENLKLI